MKIIELKIDENDENTGWDAIALVEHPAIEQDFYAFSKHQFKTYSDYPDGVKNAAKMGIKRNKEIGNKCATQVGKVRAQQLANGEPISVDTIKRMKSFLSRQKDNYDLAVSRKDYEACGYISYLLWGGPAGLTWSEKKLRQIEKESMSVEDTIVESLIALALSEERMDLVSQDGSPINHMVYNKFARDLQEKQMIIAPVMRADFMIPRMDEEGNEYQVYFSADTIKKIAYKAMKEGKIHNINLEHNQEWMVDDVYMVETWLVEDPETDKATLYGFQPNKGDWYSMFKIDNETIWNDVVKTGMVKGVSIEGYFIEKLIKK